MNKDTKDQTQEEGSGPSANILEQQHQQLQQQLHHRQQQHQDESQMQELLEFVPQRQPPQHHQSQEIDPSGYQPYDPMQSGSSQMYQILPPHMSGELSDCGEITHVSALHSSRGFGRPRLHPLKPSGMSRPRGRPKGSKNKRPRKQKDTTRIERPPKRPRGRPRKWPPEMWEGFQRTREAAVQQLQRQREISGGVGRMGAGTSSSSEDMILVGMPSSSTGPQNPSMLGCCQPPSVVGGIPHQHVDSSNELFTIQHQAHMQQQHQQQLQQAQSQAPFLHHYMPVEVDSDVQLRSGMVVPNSPDLAMMMSMHHPQQQHHQHHQHTRQQQVHVSSSEEQQLHLLHQQNLPSSSSPSSMIMLEGQQQQQVVVTEHEELLWLQQQQQQHTEMALQQHHHMHHHQQPPHTTS